MLEKNMLDYHYETFLVVCQTLNYTRASEILNLTQPAVSNHIAYLEDTLGVKLFEHRNRKVFMTKEAEFLRGKLQYILNASNHILEELESLDYVNINLGCTLSISDYAIPEFFIKMFNEEKKFRLNVLVENTSILLNYLAEGKIDAAFIEGDFNQNTFSYIPYKKAKIVAICSPDFELADRPVSFSDLFGCHLITREKGSGTRSSFEKGLEDNHISLDSFSYITTLGSIDLIKRVVEANVGISFLFDICVQDELERGTLKLLDLKEEFRDKNLNFVYLSDNPTTDFIFKLKEKLANDF